MSATSQSAGVLSFEQARETVLEYCRQIAPPASEDVSLLAALGRVLAASIHADRDFPPFPRATRDGYAVRAADLTTVPAILRVVGQVKAGASWDRPVGAGEAVEIMTGAAVPEGSDTVVMVEYTALKSGTSQAGDGRTGAGQTGEGQSGAGAGQNVAGQSVAGQSVSEQGVSEHSGAGQTEGAAPPEGQASEATQAAEVEIQRSAAAGENIVAAGAEARKGQEILPRGVRMGPAQIAMAAGAGQTRINVYRLPHVAILSTGDELVEVARTPGPFQIRNSNSYSLAAQVMAAGGEPMRLPVAPDAPRKLSTLIQAGLAADMLLVSGGVSMGKFDLVEKVLKRLGAEFFFTGALIQPGRPVVFGQVGFSGQGNGSGKVRRPRDPGPVDRAQGRLLRRIPFFGLPGNPLSAMVCFDLFARPVLEALGGAVPSRLPVAQARLRKAVKTKTGLTRFLPAVFFQAGGFQAGGFQAGGVFAPEVEVVAWQGSGDLLASARANCYLVVPPDRDSIAAGEMVSVLLR